MRLESGENRYNMKLNSCHHHRVCVRNSTGVPIKVAKRRNRLKSIQSAAFHGNLRDTQIALPVFKSALAYMVKYLHITWRLWIWTLSSARGVCASLSDGELNFKHASPIFAIHQTRSGQELADVFPCSSFCLRAKLLFGWFHMHMHEVRLAVFAFASF